MKKWLESWWSNAHHPESEASRTVFLVLTKTLYLHFDSEQLHFQRAGNLQMMRQFVKCRCTMHPTGSWCQGQSAPRILSKEHKCTEGKTSKKLIYLCEVSLTVDKIMKPCSLRNMLSQVITQCLGNTQTSKLYAVSHVNVAWLLVQLVYWYKRYSRSVTM